MIQLLICKTEDAVDKLRIWNAVCALKLTKSPHLNFPTFVTPHFSLHTMSAEVQTVDINDAIFCAAHLKEVVRTHPS